MIKLGNFILRQDESDKPSHVGEGSGLDVRDEVVGHVDRQQLRLGAEYQGGEGI